MKRAINTRVVGKGLDYYATPEWVTQAGIDAAFPPDWDDLPLIWEPACGGGHMSRMLRLRYRNVLATDYAERGSPEQDGQHDFLAPLTPLPQAVQEAESFAVITNPPFGDALEFVLRALHFTPHIAILARLAWLEGGTRHDRLFSRHPPTSVHVFCHRIAYMKDGVERGNDSGIAANAWFVWDRGVGASGTVVKWITAKKGVVR